MNRREFLQSSMASGALVSWGLTVPTFLSRTAAAAPMSDRPGAKDTILVVIQMTGGNDGLNTVIPYADEEYAKLRPTLRQNKAQIKKINDHVGLHPSMGGLAGLLGDQALCVVQGVGYPNPSQSHFRSMDIWQGGSTAETLSEGWIGKALKQAPAARSFHLADNNESAPLALAGAPARVPSLSSLEDFQLRTAAASSSDKKEQRNLIESAAKLGTGQPNLLDFVKRTAVNTYDASRRLREIGANYQPKAPYPNTPLANRLKLAAQLIDADLGARIFYVSIDGFDTHANQMTTHGNLLQMTFSEFGRRARENGSRGTDHGSAAPMLLVGGKVKAGVVGEHPSLTKLEMGNLKHHTDFRQVYASILDKWLGVSSKDVLGESFKPVQILKG